MRLSPLSLNFGLSALTSGALLLIVGISSGPIMVGKLGLWMGYAVILSQFISFGMQNGIYDVCKNDANAAFEYTKIALFSSLLIGLIIWPPLFLASQWLYDFHSLNISALLAYSFAISLQKIFRSSFTIIAYFDDFHFISIFKSVVTAGLGVIIYFGFLKIDYLFISLTLIEFLVSLIMAVFFFAKNNTELHYDFNKGVTLLKKSYMGFISNSIYEINSKIDIIIGSLVLSPSYLGVYTTVVTVFEGFIALCTLRKSETFAIFFKAAQDDDIYFIDSTIKSEFYFLLKWLLPCFILGIAFIYMTVGDFSLVTISLLFLMLTSANILGSVLGLQNIYYSFGKQNIFSKIMLSALIINVIGSVFLGHYIGMLGIGLSTAMATVYVAIQIRRFIGVINA